MTPDRERLTLEVEDSTVTVDDQPMSRIHFYGSSRTDAKTGARLLSISTRGPGMRLTLEQAMELHAWLGKWVES